MSPAGHGIGPELLDRASGSADDDELTSLRFDAWIADHRWHAYYRHFCFQHLGAVESRVSGACFQRAVQPHRRALTMAPRGELPGVREASW